MRRRNILVITIDLLVVLPIGGIGIFIAVFNPNSWEPRVQDVVMRATGRAVAERPHLDEMLTGGDNRGTQRGAGQPRQRLLSANGDRARHRGGDSAAATTAGST
jgi:hypothetical protein